jgi:hypothetical protein
MDFKLRLVAGAYRAFPPGKCHDVMVVIVTEERKPAVCPVRRDPLIAIRQRNEVFFFRSRPPQPQAGNCALHTVNDRERAPVVAHERRRIDDKVEVVLGGRHFNTNP